jgi:hypothetical protein
MFTYCLAVAFSTWDDLRLVAKITDESLKETKTAQNIFAAPDQ